MTNIERITQAVSETIRRDCPPAIAMAVGGSRSASKEDAQSDLDLVILLRDGPLLERCRRINEHLRPLLEEPEAITGGPSWKEGFGCRTSHLYRDGFKVEIFVNTLDTVPVVPRVLKWQPLWGEDVLRDVRDRVEAQLQPEHVLRKAIFDVSYAHMSICRHLSRNELFAARHVLTSLVAIALALRLFEVESTYDPVSSYKRIHRDGLSTDPMVVRIDHAASLMGQDAAHALQSLRALTDICVQLIERQPAGIDSLKAQCDRLRAIGAVCESWTSR